jgi:hypothetical protein
MAQAQDGLPLLRNDHRIHVGAKRTARHLFIILIITTHTCRGPGSSLDQG